MACFTVWFVEWSTGMFVACYVDGIAITARKGTFVVTIKGKTTVFRPGEGLHHNHTIVEFYAGRINIDSRSKTAVTTDVSVHGIDHTVAVATYTHSTKEWDNWAGIVAFSEENKSMVRVRINSHVSCSVRRIYVRDNDPTGGSLIRASFYQRGIRKSGLVF